MATRAKIMAARRLRRRETGSEYVLWQKIRGSQLGVKFRRQHVIAGFILDFYCPEKFLGIEVDGAIHKKRASYDAARDEVLAENGVKIIRFLNDEVLYEPKKVVEKIKEAVRS